jgi:hypothetical protein
MTWPPAMTNGSTSFAADSQQCSSAAICGPTPTHDTSPSPWWPPIRAGNDHLCHRQPRTTTRSGQCRVDYIRSFTRSFAPDPMPPSRESRCGAAPNPDDGAVLRRLSNRTRQTERTRPLDKFGRHGPEYWVMYPTKGRRGTYVAAACPYLRIGPSIRVAALLCWQGDAADPAQCGERGDGRKVSGLEAWREFDLSDFQ